MYSFKLKESDNAKMFIRFENLVNSEVLLFINLFRKKLFKILKIFYIGIYISYKVID